MSRLLAAAALLLAACSTEIRAGDYLQTCSRDDECLPVFEGDVCAVCACPNAAIRSGEKPAFDADVADARGRCGPTPAIACGPCMDTRGVCVAGKCGIEVK